MGSRVYVGRLSYRASERDIEHFFRGYGRMRDIVLKNGFGFVEFDDPRDADDAVYELNGKDLCGERVVLEFSRRGPRGRDSFNGGSRGPVGGRRDSGRGSSRFPMSGSKLPGQTDQSYGPPQQTRHRLIIENLSSRCSWQDLKDVMRTAGEVTFADAHKQHRNEGIVCFANRADLETALEKLQGKDVNGRKIKLVDDSDRGSRSRSRSRSRGSRSRSRSRSRRSSRSRSRSRSRSSRSRSKSRSRSRSADDKKKDKDDKKEKDDRRSRSRSHSKSRSKSPDAKDSVKEDAVKKDESADGVDTKTNGHASDDEKMEMGDAAPKLQAKEDDDDEKDDD